MHWGSRGHGAVPPYRRWLLGWQFLLTLALLAGLAGAAAAQDRPVQLKLSHWVPPSHPLQAAIEAWAKSIAEDSHGSITSVIFPAQQLGRAFDHYDMARDGIADVAYVNAGYQPGRFPVIAAGELPFLFADGKGGSAALDAWYRSYAAREMADTHFCLAFVHDPGGLHLRSRKVVLPEDLRGLKIRPADATLGNLVTLLGGTNIQASAPESRDILARGVADGIFFPWGSVVLFGIDKVVKYDMDLPLYVTDFVWTMNKARYEGMSAAQKQVIDAHCTTEWALRLATPWADFEAAGRAKLRAEPGHEVYVPTPEQVALWRQAAAPLTDQWADGVRRAGLDPAPILQALKDSLAHYNAAY